MFGDAARKPSMIVYNGVWRIVMTKKLKLAWEKVSQLPASDQDFIASVIMEELESERRWDELFSKSQDVLEKLADEARSEIRAGKTTPLIRKRSR